MEILTETIFGKQSDLTAISANLMEQNTAEVTSKQGSTDKLLKKKLVKKQKQLKNRLRKTYKKH